jgi:hypothetical protein
MNILQMRLSILEALSEDEHKPQGFYINVDGIQAHVLGDADMSAEAEQAIHEMVKCVYDAMANGKLDELRKPGWEKDT